MRREAAYPLFAAVLFSAIIICEIGGAGAQTENVANRGGDWVPGYWISDLDDNALSSVVFDDGSGPALYVGGHFINATGEQVNGIARWDGSSWSALSGPGGTGTDFYVAALAVFDDGTGEALYAGGGFTSAGGVTVNHIAKWDGSAWSALSGPGGTGTQEWVGALATFDYGTGTALYVGGWFTTAGGVAVNNIAKWDGSAWSALSDGGGTGTSYRVNALAVYDEGGGPVLFAAGNFTTAGGAAASNIARWDGINWSSLTSASGAGTTGEVYDLVVYDDGLGPALYAGGYFSFAGGVSTNNVARWDGSDWSSLSGPAGTGTVGPVHALTVFDGGSGSELVAGGFVFVAGGVPADYIAKWDGDAWSHLEGPGGSGIDYAVRTLCVFDDGGGDDLIVGGSHRSADGQKANQIAAWDGTSWSALSSETGNGVNSIVNAFAVFDDGSGPALFVGGFFRDAGDQTVNKIGRWNGDGWASLTGPSGTGTRLPVLAMAVHDDGSGSALYVGGVLGSAGGLDVDHIARWDGSVWSVPNGPSGGAMDDNVLALVVFDDGGGPRLYAGGKFESVDGNTVNHVAAWDGVDWLVLTGPGAAGTDNYVRAMKVFDDGSGPALYIGGDFLTAGGVSVNHVARWDGTPWSALSGSTGTGVGGPVYALEVFDDGGGPALYVGGVFDSAGDVAANSVARWDGSEWSTVDGSSGNGVSSGGVFAMHAYDDGYGDALYLGGWFQQAGGVPAENLARWDGETYTPVADENGIGIDDQVEVLISYDDGTGRSLFVGGWLHSAGGEASSKIAEWDHSGVLFCDGFESGNTSAWATSIP